jgi:hypothetical protein
MDKGRALVDCSFPKPWPPLEEIPFLAFQPDTVTSCQVTAYPDGHLRCILKQGEETVGSYDTLPIEVIGDGPAIVIMMWDGPSISMYINGQILKSLQEAEAETFAVDTRDRERIGRGVFSFNNPEAKKRCKDWMDWRKQRYANPKQQAKKDRRLKSTAEQSKELQNAIVALSDLVGLVSTGKLHLLADIATRLRALVYWDDKPRSQYNPLLLRMAGRLALPLPVFAYPDSVTDLDIGDGGPQPVYHFKGYGATVQQTNPKQELMDIQEWLESPAQIERFGDLLLGTTDGAKRTMTVKEVVLESSTIFGTAHYDDDVLESLDRLRRIKATEVEMLAMFLISVASTVVGLGRFVLGELQKEGLVQAA